MKNLFTLAMLFTASVMFSQSDFKISELKQRYENSILYNNDQKGIENSLANGHVKQYVCLNKYYKIKFNEQSSFLTEEEFKKKYAKEISENDNMIMFVAEKKDFMYSLMMSNYDYRIQTQKKFKKCIKKDEVNW